jgi:hypothetical protein
VNVTSTTQGPSNIKIEWSSDIWELLVNIALIAENCFLEI